MKCRLCEDGLLEYLYGELSGEDAAAMEQHLKASPACRRAYEELASVLETVGRAEEQEPPSALHTRIMAHAREAPPARRSLLAWLMRPAAATVAVAALTAGVYFATLRHRPPGRLDERILSEESLIKKAKQRNAPPPSDAKSHAPAKEAARQAAPRTVAVQPGVIEQDEAKQEPRSVRKEAELPAAVPPAAKTGPSAGADALDRERMPAPAQGKEEGVAAGADRALGGSVEAKAPPVLNSRALLGASGTSLEERPVATEKAGVPPAIAEAVDLASEGRCDEAAKRLEAFSSEHPGDAACGTGWIEAARCYAKKGEDEAARETAEKASGIPACASEARALLESLPPAAGTHSTGSQP